jgi:hypothetical protein
MPPHELPRTRLSSSGKISALELSLAAMIDVIPASRSRRPASIISVVQKLPNSISFDRARIPVRGFDCHLRGDIQIGIRHPNPTKRCRGSIRCGEIEQGLRSMICAKRASHATDGNRRTSRIVGDRMRQDHRVRLGVWKTESAPQHVTQLVMERHPYRSETGSTDPGSEQSIGASASVGRV